MPRKKKTPEIAAPEKVIESIKGFELDWKCRGFQYAIGATYTHDGEVAACSAGFHACEYPLDVFRYYPPGQSRYAVVKQSGEISRDSDDTKIASAKITIETELRLPEIIDRAVKWIFARAKPEDTEHATGYQGAASSTGDQGAASSTGDYGAAMASGIGGRVMGADGNSLFLVYRNPDSGEIVHAWAGIVGRGGIKPNVWYRLSADGLPVEVT